MNHVWEEITGCFYIQPNSTGEQKTKPTQNSVRELRGLGLSPDLVGTLTVCTKPLAHMRAYLQFCTPSSQIVCRSQVPIVQPVKSKISNFCHVKPEQVNTGCTHCTLRFIFCVAVQFNTLLPCLFPPLLPFYSCSI